MTIKNIGVYIQGTSIISKEIVYRYNDNVADLTNWELSYNIYDNRKSTVHSDVINDRILNIYGSVTEKLKGNYIIQIVLKNGTYVDKDTLLEVTIKGV